MPNWDVRRLIRQSEVLTFQKFIRLSRCESSYCHDEEYSPVLLLFSNFPDPNFPNDRVTFRIDCHALLECHRWHLIGNGQETGNHLLRFASSLNNFSWIWLTLEEPYSRLLLCFRFTYIDPWLVIYVDVEHSLWWTLKDFF